MTKEQSWKFPPFYWPQAALQPHALYIVLTCLLRKQRFIVLIWQMSSANSKAYETRFSRVTNDSASLVYLEWLIFRAHSERLGCLKLFSWRYKKRCSYKLQELLSKVLALDYLFKVFLFKMRSSYFKLFSFESLSIHPKNEPSPIPTTKCWFSLSQL